MFRIVLALPERRNSQVQRVETVEKVGAQASLLNFLQRLPVGRGDDADLDRNDLVAADPHDLLRLQGSQQLGLQEEVHLRQFVEEQRSLVGKFEQADFAGAGRAGEGARRVAKQLALEQGAR